METIIQLRSSSFLRAMRVLLFLLAFVVLGTIAADKAWAFRVMGTVRNAGGQPVPGVDIDAVNAATGESLTLANDGTDANGFYYIYFPPGTYNIRFTPPHGSPLVSQERTNIVVMNNVTLNVTLPNGFFLFGTVRDPNLQPIAGVDVDVRDQGTNASIFLGNDDTDVNGFYAVVLPNGNYKVLFRPNPSTSYPVRVFENIAISDQDRNLNANLQNGVRLFGTASDPSGDPLPGVKLEVFDAVSGAKVWTFGSSSDSLGFYQAALLPGFRYDLVYQGPSPWGYRDLRVDSLLVAAPTQRNVTLTFPYRLSGSVQPASGGGGVPQVRIDVFSHAGGDDIPLADRHTDSNGDYRVDVPAGTIDVTFRSPEGNGLASKIIRNIQISEDTDLDALLPNGFALTGRVRRPGGTGVANVDFDIKDSVTGLEVPVFDDDTDALGDYTLVLPNGTYNLDIDPGRGVRLVAQVATGVMIPHSLPFDFQLQAGFLLSGRVVDHVANPWPDIDLDVRIANTATQIVTPGDDTDANGNYLVTVPAGTYDLAFTPPVGIPVASGFFEDVVISGDRVFDAILASTVIGVAEESAPGAASALVLEPNHPNPFNPSTVIPFAIEEPAVTTLRIYDVGGRAVRTLLEGPLAPGRHELAWDGRDHRGAVVPSGVYFARLSTGRGIRTQKMVLTR